MPLHVEPGELRRHGMLRDNLLTIGRGVSF